MKRNQNVAPITDFELALANTVARATFPVGSGPKRFIRGISEHTKLSDRGRWYLAYIANRFRRQYQLSEQQWTWVKVWLSKETNTSVPSAESVANGLTDGNGLAASETSTMEKPSSKPVPFDAATSSQMPIWQ